MIQVVKDWCGEFFGFNKIISDKTTVIDAQAIQISVLNEKVSELTNLVDSTSKADKQTILDLTAQLESLEKLYAKDPMEEYWNNRYPKTKVSYTKIENKITYAMDVRNFFQPEDDNIPTVSGNNSDEKALNALRWVRANVTYVSDMNVYGFGEYWAWAFETIARKKGDCEDGAILLANIMLKSGIPYWRIRLNAGSVKGGGHAYVTYCRETDNQFVVLDWCYWPNDKAIKDRPLHKDEQNYDDPNLNYYIWFSWNQFYIFGQMQTMAEMSSPFRCG